MSISFALRPIKLLVGAAGSCLVPGPPIPPNTFKLLFFNNVGPNNELGAGNGKRFEVGVPVPKLHAALAR